MHPYIPNTDEVLNKMLEEIGISDFKELISYIPEEFQLKRDLNLPKPHSEYQLEKEIAELVLQSKDVKQLSCFAGCGSYDHIVPAVIPFLLSRSEFYTAYTPYQAEVSQGTLQFYFEFQSLICDLTKMEVANASMYDGASATAEAVLMADRLKPGKNILISNTLNPFIKRVINTYNYGLNLHLVSIPEVDGTIDIDFLRKQDFSNVSAIVVQSPNYYGIIEDVIEIRNIIPEDVLFILNSDPISLALLKKPGDIGVDIYVGDGQSLGNGLYFGGPTCGIFASKMKYIRQLPGRIAGITKDTEGKIGFVTTLQTREQHIRRAKATSNICTSQALNALATTIFLSITGKEGLYEIAYQSLQKSHYLADKIKDIYGFSLVYDKPFFLEFLMRIPINNRDFLKKALEKNILAGVVPENREKELLVAVTEKRTKEELDQYIDFLKSF